MKQRILLTLGALIACCQSDVGAADASGAKAATGAQQETAAERGYRYLTTKAYLPPDFDQEVFDELWKTWEPELREKAERASPEDRRRMAFERYGLTERSEGPAGMPQQYVVDAQGNWSMNCLACHQGQVGGKAYPGVPNNAFALETLTEEVRATKLRMKKKLSHMDLGFLLMPLGTTAGTTNAVMFGVILLSHRDADLNVVDTNPTPSMKHHDHDAPAWWHFHRKPTIYIDGFAQKGHRALMQFLLVRQNGPQHFRRWESEYADVYAWLESIRPPKYPFTVDEKLAADGRLVFNNTCASCHGTYGDGSSIFPNETVPIETVGTDRTRLDSLSPEYRDRYIASWFDNYGRDGVSKRDPGGYVAPPLDGIWASAPYFHNGSVPTLDGILDPSKRPTVWTRDDADDGYDQVRVGLKHLTLEQVPTGLSRNQRRKHFDTRHPGKNNAGHPFAEELSDPDRRAILEYLKTL